LFHPGDVTLTTGGPEARRAFLDRVVEQMDPTYSAAVASYTRALRSRNRLLKTDGVDRRSVVAYDELLASAGAVIGSTRARLIDDLAPIVKDAFRDITDAALPLEAQYCPRVEPTVSALREALARSLDLDLARGFTAEGPHGDDLAFALREPSGRERERTSVRHHASQGQHRALVLALKIAELEVLTRRTGRVPVLLLDDVSSELDRTRNRRLFARLARLGGQVFLTTTHPEFILLEGDRTDFRVTNGSVEVPTP
jgi:DNA replication and repair protein RecF